MKNGVRVGVLVGVVLVVLVGAFFLFRGGDVVVDDVGGLNINIVDFDYAPGTLTIKVGDTVTWTNRDVAEHTVTSDSGDELDSVLFGKDETFSHTFETAGTFDYHCVPHPFMKGTIVVE